MVAPEIVEKIEIPLIYGDALGKDPNKRNKVDQKRVRRATARKTTWRRPGKNDVMRKYEIYLEEQKIKSGEENKEGAGD